MGQNVQFTDFLEAARRGSPDALGELLDGCREYLLLVANSELEKDVQPKLAPSDLVQETFIEAQDDFDRFGGSTERELLRWLRRMLLNNLRDAARKFRSSKKADVSREVSLETAARRLPPHDETPRRLSQRAEEFARVEFALAQLPDDQRRAVTLRSFRLLPFAEIGRQLNRSDEAARKLWARAIRTLQKQLDDDDE